MQRGGETDGWIDGEKLCCTIDLEHTTERTINSTNKLDTRSRGCGNNLVFSLTQQGEVNPSVQLLCQIPQNSGQCPIPSPLACNSTPAALFTNTSIPSHAGLAASHFLKHRTTRKRHPFPATSSRFAHLPRSQPLY
jgi:hypothetical protein